MKNSCKTESAKNDSPVDPVMLGKRAKGNTLFMVKMNEKQNDHLQTKKINKEKIDLPKSRN